MIPRNPLRRRRRRVAAAAVALLAAVASGAAAQQPELAVAGRVFGPDNQPLAQQRVVLHRVDASGGATIAEAESGADGSFILNGPATPDTSAVYFVASRLDGELYIGPPFRASQPNVMDQIIQVGVPGMSATAMLEGTQPVPPLPMGRPATSRTWLLLLVPVVGVLALVVYLLVPRGRIPDSRALLIRVAELDERMTTAPQAQREGMQAERDQLMMKLREG